MEDFDEESAEFSDNSQSSAEDESTIQDSNNKRSKHSNVRHKKVKYEDISENPPDKKNKKNELYKPPTVEELNNLKETENLYNNNLFRLQIKELVSEVNIKNKRKKQLSMWLQSFKHIIENVKEYDNILLSDIKVSSNVKKLHKKDKFINNIASSKYQCKLKTDQDLVLKFLKPESYEIFGLYANNCLCGPDLELKINIKMQRTCFNLKDFLNNRYLVKRYYYLLYINEQINIAKITSSTKIIYHNNSNVLLPVLEVFPIETDKISVKIYVTPPSDYFKPSRFVPEMNNIKTDLYDTDCNIDILKETPTIYYNSTLAHDVTLSLNNDYIKNILNDRENIQEGIKLLSIWLRQRELDIGFGAFTPELAMYFVAYLVTKKKINEMMSSYQVIRSFWSFITNSDLHSNPISFTEVNQEVLESFKKSFDIVFLDQSGCYNLAAFLCLGVYEKIKTECSLALKHLDEGHINSFHSLFITKLPFYLQYDLVLDVTQSFPLKNKTITDAEKSKYMGYRDIFSINQLLEILQRGLNKRLAHLVPRVEINEDITESNMLKNIMLGINLEPDEAFNFLELGPALNDHIEADEFRKFWGHLSSDRRFRDGSTKVAVYFKTRTIKDKRSIVKKIIKFLLTEKLKIEKYKLYFDEFEEFIIHKRIVPPYPMGTNEDGCLKVINIADELGKKIRGFQMSLSITGIQGLSDSFSYTEIFPPIATNHVTGFNITMVKHNNVIFAEKKIGMIPRYLQPIECVLQLEHSSKWPNTLEAIRQIKTSFYLEISKMLRENDKILTHVTKDYLEVYYEGLVFRYRLYVPKEIALIKKDSTESGVVVYKESSASLKLDKNLNVLPKVHAALKGIQLQHPSFGPGTAIIKRWLRSQLIDDYHFPDIIISLLNASLYLDGTAFTESNTPQISFLRFLKFMTEFQWSLQPVVVNFNEEIEKQDISEMESKFQQNREAFPQLYIILPYDNGNSIFSKNSPTKEILFRVQQLATATLQLVTQSVVNQHVLEIKNIFLPNWEGYNVLIHLRPLLNPRRHEQIQSENESRMILEKYDNEKNKKIPIVGFNPVELYLKTLRENYEEFATFFHDTFGGNTIGVLWLPKSLEPKEFKVLHVSGRKLVDDKLVLNVDAIIDDFYLIGKDLVKSIEKR